MCRFGKLMFARCSGSRFWAAADGLCILLGAGCDAGVHEVRYEDYLRRFSRFRERSCLRVSVGCGTLEGAYSEDVELIFYSVEFNLGKRYPGRIQMPS